MEAMSKSQLEEMSRLQKKAMQSAAMQYAGKIFPGTFGPETLWFILLQLNIGWCLAIV